MGTMLHLARTCGLLAVPLLAACTIVLDTDRHRSDVVPIAATDFCAEFADIACTGRRDCCPRPAPDFDACISAAVADCANNFGALGIDSVTGYDPGQAGLALAEARDLVAACDPHIETWRLSRLGSERILAGTIPFGETCEPNFFAARTYFACVDDGACTQMGTSLDPDWQCAPPTPQDGECTYDRMCEPGLRCTAAVEFLTTGTCQPLQENGQTCRREAECATHVCDTTCRDATNEEAYCGD